MLPLPRTTWSHRRGRVLDTGTWFVVVSFIAIAPDLHRPYTDVCAIVVDAFGHHPVERAGGGGGGGRNDGLCFSPQTSITDFDTAVEINNARA